ASAGYHFLHSDAYVREQVRARLQEADDLWNQGRKDDAIALRKQTVEMQKAKLGPNHIDTLVCMSGLANAYSRMGRLPEAITLLQQTLEGMKATLGPGHTDTLHCMYYLANAYSRMGRLPETVTLLEEMLEKLGPDHSATQTVTYRLAVSYQDAGQFDRA